MTARSPSSRGPAFVAANLAGFAAAFVALGASACGGAPPRAVPTSPTPPSPSPSTAAPPQPVPAVECDTALGDGTALQSDGKIDEAAALFERAIARCGNGHGLHNALGLVRAGQHRPDDAASEYIAELKDPSTVPQVFPNLHRVYDQLGEARQREIAGLGATTEAPIKVPAIRFEYLWVTAFGCAGAQGTGTVKSQALIHTKTRSLDRLDYDCPDGKHHEAYFDYSDDPDEKALMEELKKSQEKPQKP